MSIERKVIKLLQQDDWKYLRTIKISGKEWNQFTGFLSYFRDHNCNIIDSLDEAILEGFNSFNVNAEFYTNEEIILEGQAENRLEKTEGTLTENIIIQINPKVNEELYKLATIQNVYYYPKEFKVQIFNGLTYSGVNKYVQCYVEYNQLENLISTINPIK
jgi:hypothetical protein